MLIESILSLCNERQINKACDHTSCSYAEYCPNKCETCLEYVHFPDRRPPNAPQRKYDCPHMADFYTCKYSCRYASELAFGLQHMQDLVDCEQLRILSFGCGPCTDLFSIDYLHYQGVFHYSSLEYRGIDYSPDVWSKIHTDIKNIIDQSACIEYYYRDACEFIGEIADDAWIPNLIVFQYVFSDMHKHTAHSEIERFLTAFAQYFNNIVSPNTYIIINDINLGCGYGGGRDYFDLLYSKLSNVQNQKYHFPNSQPKRKAYNYGTSEITENKNLFDLSPWSAYAPFETCASAQMLIRKKVNP